MKLIQKRFLKGTREFEVIDNAILVREKGFLSSESATIDLSTLDPSPVVKGAELEFYSRYRGRPVFTIHIDKPNATEFNAFIDALKSTLRGGGASAGGEAVSTEFSRSEAPGWNVYEEPAEPDESEDDVGFQPVSAVKVEEDIAMLKTYLNEPDIQPLLASLEVLKAEPQNEMAYKKMLDVFNNLGIKQGAVLTYAPYLKILLSRSIW